MKNGTQSLNITRAVVNYNFLVGNSSDYISNGLYIALNIKI